MDSRPLFSTLAGKFATRPWTIFLSALAVTVVAIWCMLDTPLLTSRKALLPQDVDVSKRLNRFLDQFGAASDLIVVVDRAPVEVAQQFATDLAAKLRTLPNVRQAIDRIDLTFFFKLAYLLVPPETLNRFDAVLEKLINVPAPKELADWDEAAQRVEGWLDSRPPLSNVDVSIQTAEASLSLMQFFLEEWVRWIEAPQVPREFNWQRLLKQHGAGGFATGMGYFLSRDGGMLFLFVRPQNPSEEFEVVGPFVDEVRLAAEELRAEYAKAGKIAPVVGLTGLPAITYEEYSYLQRDILFTLSTAAGLILLLIIVWLRSLRWALAVFVPMGLGVFWSVMLTRVTIGHLTLITSGFTAILFGLGCDWGVFMSSRIMEERSRKVPLLQAICNGVAASSRALLTCGGATILIFGSLAFVPFSGFSELGMVAAFGVLMTLVATFVVQPPLFAKLPPAERLARRYQLEPVAASARKPTKFFFGVNVALVVVAVIGAGAGAVLGVGIPFDYDVLSLLPKGSEAAHYQRRMVEESDYQGEVIIFTAPDMAQARRLAQAASKRPSISQVQTITDLFPEDMDQRVEVARRVGKTVADSRYLEQIMRLGRIKLSGETMKRIQSSVEKTQTLLEDSQEMAFSAGQRKIVKQLEAGLTSIETVLTQLEENPERAQARTELFAQAVIDMARLGFEVITSWQTATPLTPAGLPDQLRDRFVGKDGSVVVYAVPARSVYDPQNLEALMNDVYSVSPQATGFPTTHQVFSKMAVQSFRFGTLLALAVAILWILVVVREPKGFVIALLPLLIGGGWMLGIFALLQFATGFKFSYANIIALPLVMGLAVDYGVWYAHRFRELPELSAWQVARVAGKAIWLAAATVLAGLGAIMLASYRGVSSMGTSITIGICCCLVATLVITPAVSTLFFRRKP